MRSLSRRTRLFILPTVILIAAIVAAFGAWASFTSSTTAVTQNFSTGTFTVDVGATGGQANRLNVNATDVNPGDTIQRSVDLINSGTLDFGAITLTTDATTSSVLDTDTTDGLQMSIDHCSNSWTESGTSPNYTYICGGSTSTVLASRPVVGSNLSLSNLDAVNGGNTDHLRVTFTLPSTADNTFEGKSSSIRFVFTAN